tara:strand:- start:257 stop:460 length:204 start_codon:yes stop_codon:yes gene_type:complete
MNGKLLRAFIEASGYEIEEVVEPFSEPGCCVRVADYKVTKKPSVSITKNDMDIRMGEATSRMGKECN